MDDHLDRHRIRMNKLDRLAIAEMCKCGKNPETEEIHSCPYNKDIYDDDSDYCFCCDTCMQECLHDI